MSRWLVSVVAILVLAVGAGQATAHGGKRGLRSVALRSAAAYVGVTGQELRLQLRSGQSLAQVAAAKGKSVDGLKQALTAGVRARLDRAVANGRISAEQAQRMLARFQARLDTIVNRVWIRR